MPITLIPLPSQPLVSVDDFFPFVQPDISNCPNSLVRRKIVDAAIEFCEKSLAITVILDAIPLVESQPSYAITAPTDMRMIEITEMFGPQLFMIPKTLRELQELYPNWLTAIGSTPAYYMMLDPHNVRVVPIPTNVPSGFSMTPRIAVAPIITANVVHEDLFNRYVDTIAEGAKARLMRMPKQPWTDLKTAADSYSLFLNGIDAARIEVMRLRTAGSTSVAPRKFA